jgi:hypothetical protein
VAGSGRDPDLINKRKSAKRGFTNNFNGNSRNLNYGTGNNN